MSAKKWELKLKQVEGMVSQSNVSLRDRVQLLVEVFDDQRFHAFHQGDMDAMEEHLNKYLGDYGIDFFDARAMLKHFPSESAWRDGKIRELLAQAMEREQEVMQSTPSPSTRPRVKRQDYEKAIEKIERLEKANESYQDENTTLRTRVAELERDIAVANGRIAELERILDTRLSGVR